uniref:(northern house mosquito) hypothetical protein n=1 Tax=Culex pipiens TaxID=7175 RepID=A0A8D8GNC4_CULPI
MVVGTPPQVEDFCRQSNVSDPGLPAQEHVAPCVIEGQPGRLCVARDLAARAAQPSAVVGLPLLGPQRAVVLGTLRSTSTEGTTPRRTTDSHILSGDWLPA